VGRRWVLKMELWFTKVTSPASILTLSAISSKERVQVSSNPIILPKLFSYEPSFIEMISKEQLYSQIKLLLHS
jgi:hypothetical protein